MAAHQAPLSLGFSRQEHWSGLPFPSPMRESEKWKWSRSVGVRPSATPWTAAFQAPPSMGFSRQEYWSGEPLGLKPGPWQWKLRILGTEKAGNFPWYIILLWIFSFFNCTIRKVLKYGLCVKPSSQHREHVYQPPKVSSCPLAIPPSYPPSLCNQRLAFCHFRVVCI